MSKEYKIKTIKQVLEIINKDNVECFKTDFCNWLDAMIGLKEMTKTLSELDVAELADEEVFERINWIDDGKNDQNIKIKIETKL